MRSRVVLARTGSETPRRPSAGAQAIALLLEDPKRTYEAAEIAERLDCSVPIARTTLNRLVQRGNATRVAAGRFRAKAR
jgi:predicted ArsR family transcriptional regulator